MTGIAPGSRLRSIVCTTEVIVLKAPSAQVELQCGGHPMITINATPNSAAVLDPAHSAGTMLGKRYVHTGSSLEVLCTKSGAGSLAVNGERLESMASKQLPSSD